jgi:hypothetical protein
VDEPLDVWLGRCSLPMLVVSPCLTAMWCAAIVVVSELGWQRILAALEGQESPYSLERITLMRIAVVLICVIVFPIGIALSAWAFSRRLNRTKY